MVSGVDSPIAQNPLIEASGSVALVNQAKQGAILNSSQLVVGKQFQAEVVTALEDGTYIVKVADIAARMQLPNSPQVGAKLSLTLISTSPRATFLLGSPEDEEAAASSSAASTTSTATLGTVKQLIDDFVQASGNKNTTTTAGLYLQSGANVTAVTNANPDPRLISLATVSPDGTPTTFSSAGKLVDQLLQNTSQQETATVSKVPLLTTPDVNIGVMAKALQSGVTSSGVFYESHLLQWAEGTLNVAELMKEPQANFKSLPENSPTTGTSNTNANAQANTAANSPINANSLIISSANLLSSTATTTQSNSTTNPIASAVITLPPTAAPLIQQQLQTMEQQRFVWHGELWPGQPMEWEISRDQPKQQGETAERTWQSAVRFELPQLGAISAQLQLTGTHLRLSVQAKDAPTALMLQNHAGELVAALDGTGAQLDSLLIKIKP
ncbi:flagellar hook-length control protein FliK [Solimicrobium silvestre]|uniref:Flagellar hook-length control protein FliK n=1 Tax=Solimicrobium silvestre TaxID=2099400 RepID=A0A2S9GST5_9BURK|nr:flagellar hook-length control protein FliK [Solimicrobium silvestre]PRC90773.1 Flagellar hook-length control protein FliK [Solimicrobium silvestre]